MAHGFGGFSIWWAGSKAERALWKELSGKAPQPREAGSRARREEPGTPSRSHPLVTTSHLSEWIHGWKQCSPDPVTSYLTLGLCRDIVVLSHNMYLMFCESMGSAGQFSESCRLYALHAPRAGGQLAHVLGSCPWYQLWLRQGFGWDFFWSPQAFPCDSFGCLQQGSWIGNWELHFPQRRLQLCLQPSQVQRTCDSRRIDEKLWYIKMDKNLRTQLSRQKKIMEET